MLVSECPSWSQHRAKAGLTPVKGWCNGNQKKVFKTTFELLAFVLYYRLMSFRYSEFEDLRSKLAITFPHAGQALPPLPPKSVLCEGPAPNAKTFL